jgi:acyl-CoA dehydrogenase
LKRWEDEGRQEADLPVLHYTAANAFKAIQGALDDVIVNLPARWAAWILRVLIAGGRQRGPDDRLIETCSELLFHPSATRERIVGAVHEGCARDGVQVLNRCYAKVTEMEPVMKRLREAWTTPQQALEAGILSAAEMTQIEEMNALIAEVVAVDDFAPDALAAFFPEAAQGRRKDNDSIPKEAAE